MAESELKMKKLPLFSDLSTVSSTLSSTLSIGMTDLELEMEQEQKRNNRDEWDNYDSKENLLDCPGPDVEEDFDDLEFADPPEDDPFDHLGLDTETVSEPPRRQLGGKPKRTPKIGGKPKRKVLVGTKSSMGLTNLPETPSRAFKRSMDGPMRSKSENFTDDFGCGDIDEDLKSMKKTIISIKKEREWAPTPADIWGEALTDEIMPRVEFEVGQKVKLKETQEIAQVVEVLSDQFDYVLKLDAPRQDGTQIITQNQGELLPSLVILAREVTGTEAEVYFQTGQKNDERVYLKAAETYLNIRQT